MALRDLSILSGGKSGIEGIPVYSALMYRGLPGEIVVRLKFSGEKHLAKTAAHLIVQYSSILPSSDDIIVPIPVSVKRRRHRGYNQVALIAGKLASISGCRYIDLLTRSDRPTQVGLSPFDRRENVKGSFRMKKESTVLSGSSIWLVDDVATTCSTIDSAAETLVRSGARSVTGLTLTYRKREMDSIINR